MTIKRISTHVQSNKGETPNAKYANLWRILLIVTSCWWWHVLLSSKLYNQENEDYYFKRQVASHKWKGGGREWLFLLTLNACIQSFISLSLWAASTQSFLLFHVDSVWIVNWNDVLRSPEWEKEIACNGQNNAEYCTHYPSFISQLVCID